MKNTIGKILYYSLIFILISFIFIEPFYMNHEYELILVYFHALILLFLGIFMMFFTLMLINIRLPYIDFSNKQSKKSFWITIFFIFITYFVIGEYLWSFLLSGLTEINLIKTNNPEVLTRIIPTIGAGLIFFYKIFGYMDNVNFDSIKDNFKSLFPFILLDSGELNFIKDILRGLIIGSVFLAFLILGINGKTLIVQYSYLHFDATLSAIIVSVIFTFLEVYVWILTTQYKDNLVDYAKEANLNLQNNISSKENNIQFQDYFIGILSKSKRLKQIYSFIDKRKRIFYVFMILALLLLSGYIITKSIYTDEEYVSIKANIVNISISENSTDKIYYSEIVYPNEKQFSFQLGKTSSINNTHVLKKVDESRADAQLQKIVKNGYINVDVEDTFSCVKMRINKNKMKNLTSYIVPQEKTQLLFSPIDGDVFLFLSEKLNITQFYQISITDYSMTGEIYIYKLNVFNETGNTSFIRFYEHYHIVPVKDVVIISMYNKTLANELKDFISNNNPDYTYLIINETDIDLERIYGKCLN